MQEKEKVVEFRVRRWRNDRKEKESLTLSLLSSESDRMPACFDRLLMPAFLRNGKLSEVIVAVLMHVKESFELVVVCSFRAARMSDAVSSCHDSGKVSDAEI